MNLEFNDPQFAVKLIKALPSREIADNCTHVTGHWWIFEGDEDALESEVDIRAEGVVGALGGLDTDHLIQVCIESFGINPNEEDAKF